MDLTKLTSLVTTLSATIAVSSASTATGNDNAANSGAAADTNIKVAAMPAFTRSAIILHLTSLTISCAKKVWEMLSVKNAALTCEATLVSYGCFEFWNMIS